MATVFDRRRLLSAALAGLGGVAGVAPRPGPPDVPPADRARLRAAAADFEAAAEAALAMNEDLDRIRELLRAGEVSPAEHERALVEWFWPGQARFVAADRALSELMRGCGVGALIVAGELYVDLTQDDTQDVDAGKYTSTLDASLILDLDAAGA